LKEFGHLRLGDIRTQAIKRWLVRLRKEGLSPSRIRQAFQCLSACLQAAVDDDRLLKNPPRAARSELPPLEARRERYLSYEEFRLLIAAAHGMDPAAGVLVATLGLAGLRWTEAAALRRCRCYDAPGELRLHVAESLENVNGSLRFKSVKNHRERWVDIPGALGAMLGEHLMCRVDPDPDALVFTTVRGRPLDYSNYRRTVWDPAVRLAGLPSTTTPGVLRHTGASLMLQATSDLYFVKEQLGHSTIRVTEGYSHLMPSDRRLKAARLDEEFRVVANRVGFSLGSSQEAVITFPGPAAKPLAEEAEAPAPGGRLELPTNGLTVRCSAG